MATVVNNVINLIVKRSALTPRLIQSLIMEMHCTYRDTYLSSAVRWLSREKVCVGCFDAIKAFLAEKEQDYPELQDVSGL